MLSSTELKVIDMIIEELETATQIKATRTAVVRAIFTNGYDVYMRWEWLEEKQETMLKVLEASVRQEELVYSGLRHQVDMNQLSGSKEEEEDCKKTESAPAI